MERSASLKEDLKCDQVCVHAEVCNPPHVSKSLFLWSYSRYNAQAHPIAFHKATDLGKLPQKIAGAPAPDLEEAYDVRVSSVP